MECKKVSPVTRDLTKHLTTHTGGRTDEKRKMIVFIWGSKSDERYLPAALVLG